MLALDAASLFPFAWSLPALGVIFFLYAEIHYHFKVLPSLLYQRQPEIVADAPHRLDPGQPLPVLLVVKDAHRFPISLLAAEVQIIPAGRAEAGAAGGRQSAAAAPLRTHLLDAALQISSPYWWRVFPLELPAEWQGLLHVEVSLTYLCRGRRRRCRNDNYRGTSHAPLRVYRSAWPLPCLPHYHAGDLHCHSDATSDQVEFGAPVEAMVPLAQAQGLTFFAVTDHSYDLDDAPGDYLHNDPSLRKWHELQMRIQQLNDRQTGVVVIPGEEVSCGNHAGGNVHFLVFNHPEFIRGSGDSGEKWLRTRPEHSIAEVLARLSPQALAFAAHPAVRVPFLERLLLRRACWHDRDFDHPRLQGTQFWNGMPQNEEEGLHQWRRLLLTGRKLFALAGNDAHGNCNRYRQVALPCLTLAEHDHHIFGWARTLVRLEGRRDLTTVLSALASGRAVISTGPALDMQLQHAGGVALPGSTVAPTVSRLRLQALSSPEFGVLRFLRVWYGDLARQQETLWHECETFPMPYEHELLLAAPEGEGAGYLRAEVITAPGLGERTADSGARALTNPIWIGSPTGSAP